MIGKHFSEIAIAWGGMLATEVMDVTRCPAWLTITIGIATVIYTVVKTIIIVAEYVKRRRETQFFKRRHYKKHPDERHPRDTGHWGD